MKKWLSILLILLLLCPITALAEVDLSGMSYDELVALQEQVELAIWSSDEWQEVTVPSGVYEVGTDIPAGKWTVSAADGVSAVIMWGDALDESGVDLSYDGDIYEYEWLYSPTYYGYDAGSDKTSVTYEMKDGQYFIVDSGTVVFTPYAGKTGLGFK
ncbi:MAG: hypothetical protein PHO41_11090 [Eubacteriales bacterium]|nr:hypothetical protein [Eubacteriales bacterium]